MAQLNSKMTLSIILLIYQIKILLDKTIYILYKINNNKLDLRKIRNNFEFKSSWRCSSCSPTYNILDAFYIWEILIAKYHAKFYALQIVSIFRTFKCWLTIAGYGCWHINDYLYIGLLMPNLYVYAGQSFLQRAA